MITSMRPHTQHDGRTMAFLELEEFDGSIELLVFGDAYEKFKHHLAVDAMVLVHGIIGKRSNEEKGKLKVDNCIALSDARGMLTRSVHLRLHTQGLEVDFLQDIRKIIREKPGECALVLHIVTAERNEYRVKSRQCKLTPDHDIIRELRGRVGKENVWLAKTAA